MLKLLTTLHYISAVTRSTEFFRTFASCRERKALHITHMIIHTTYIDKHTTLDALHFQPNAKILKSPVLASA